MTRDELEFQISQYLDGTIAGAEANALEDRLARDADARALLDEHRTITELLRRDPLPEVKWEMLSQSISAAVGDVEPPVAESYPIFRLRMPMVFAIAASVVIAGGVAVAVLLHGHTPAGPSGVPEQVAKGSITIEGPTVEKSMGPVVAEVTVGPGESLKGDTAISSYAEEITSRPSHVVVASDVVPDEQPSGSGPY
jgi:anti-sigma factor RsiW